MDNKNKNPITLPIVNIQENTCCGTSDKSGKPEIPLMEQLFVKGSLDTEAGPIPKVVSQLTWEDSWGSIKARWNVGRMNYKVTPGVYALGDPDRNSHVLVTANYKMSFDALRESVPGLNAWILVLDTDGVNVWCAAGKGTFGTEELIHRIDTSGLKNLVSHREIILPQLGAPGVAAHAVKKESGFKVIYGPILSKDIPAFLDTGLKATPEMRRKKFTLRERIVLIPIELVMALKWSLISIVIFSLLEGFRSGDGFFSNILSYGIFPAMAILSALIAGAVLTPIFLSWLPGRAFSVKGMISGLFMMAVLMHFKQDYLATMSGRMEVLAWLFIAPAFSAYLAMNFTGSSTYTSLSGVRKEMKYAVPMEIVAGVIGLCLFAGSFVI